MKKILLFATVAALAFVGCSDSDDSGNNVIKVPPGTTTETLTVVKGQTAVIEGTVKKLIVEGGDIEVAKTGSVGDLTIRATTDITKPSIITIIAPPAKVTGTIDNKGGAKISWTAYNKAELLQVLAMAPKQNSGAMLGANVANEDVTIPAAFVVGEYEGEAEYKPTPYDGYVLDGKGFTLSGAAYNDILHIQSHNVTVKNLIVTQTAAQKEVKKSNGINVYRMNGVVLEDVTVKDCAKAGVVVNASKVTATNLTTSGNAWGGVNISLSVEPAGGNAPEFVLVSGTFAENVKVYVDITYTPTYTVKVPADWENSEVTIPAGAPKVMAYYPKGQAPKNN